MTKIGTYAAHNNISINNSIMFISAKGCLCWIYFAFGGWHAFTGAAGVGMGFGNMLMLRKSMPPLYG